VAQSSEQAGAKGSAESRHGSDAATPPRLFLAGTSHRLSPLELRERFALLESDLAASLDELKSLGAGEAVLIATCDRIELLTSDPALLAQLAPLVARRTGHPAEQVAAALYRHDGAAALRHLFAVASALDSLVVGEPQVLGQVKAAHRAAAELGLVGPAIEGVFAAAFACARRVRRETPIAARPMSLAVAALDLALGIHGNLARSEALLLGPSEMGELMAEHFRRGGLGRLVVCGPAERARPAALRLVANYRPLDELDEALAGADIVIAALATGRIVLTAPRIAAALHRRPRRPIFVIDAAIPPDAEPGVNDLEGAFLYDLADLERAAVAGPSTREQDLAAAWRIVDAEVAAYQARQAERRAVPTVVALRRHFERLRDEVMAERGLDAAAATRLLVNRLLHDPSEALRDLAASGGADVAAMEMLLRRLFRLGDEDET